MKNKSSKNPFKPITDLFSRYNFVIFIVVIVSGLITSVLILNTILRVPYITSYDTEDTTRFDDSTISQVNSLKISSDNIINMPVSSGRITLFSE